MNIVDFLDKRMDDPSVAEWLAKLGPGQKEEFPDRGTLASVRHHFKASGISVEFSRYPSKIMALSCLTFYTDPSDGFAVFVGETSPDLHGYTSREMVRKELGTPSKSGAEFGAAGRTWDNFDRDKYFLGFTYERDLKVVRIQFQSRGYYKDA